MTDEEIEAANIKYNCDRIVRLSTGRFALFSAWGNRNGIPLIAIGSLSELEPLIETSEECEAKAGAALPDFDPDAAIRGQGKVSAAELLAGFNLPKPKITRRF